jgi:CRISPR system Cascade subunit CasB
MFEEKRRYPKMSEREPTPIIAEFFRRLEQLDPGQRARLKRSAGQTMGEAGSDVLSLFYRALPHGGVGTQESMFFMAASLFPLAEGGGKGNLGQSLRKAQNPKNKKGLDRRVVALLDADDMQLPFRLRQTIHFLQSNRVRVDWPALLDDLLHWSHPERLVQKRWAESYFSK